MKDKNRTSKVFAGIIVSSLLSALIGYVLSDILKATINQIPVNPIYLILVFSLLSVLLIAIILFRMETVDEYRYDVTKLLGDGFVRIYKDSISDFAISLVSRSKYVRVVGTARQEVVGSKTVKNASGYLSALEKKLAKKSANSLDVFTYLRVVPVAPNKNMVRHIDICNDLALKNGHKFEAIVNLNFPFYISYQVFDDTDILIILDNKGCDKKRDNALCLWSRNKEIIDIFIRRFDDAWD
jgi:hypothetical protein